MPVEKWVVVSQFIGAALGIPVAAAGAYTAFQSHFSTEAQCRQLRSTIVATMERSVADDAKRALIHKDVESFLKTCGENDPDARHVLQALYEPKHSPAATVGARGESAPHHVFGVPGAEPHGWVALNRREGSSWSVNFSGYAISHSALPPTDTILTAQRALPVWSEPQGTSNDKSQYRSALPEGACVRVLSTRGGPGRLWAEVAPASCS